MSDSIKVALIHAVLGVFVGFYVFYNAIGNGYEIFMFSLPIANFLITLTLWDYSINKGDISFLNLFIVSLLAGTFNHYLAWFVNSCISSIGYALNGSFADSLGGPPASPIMMLFGGFAFSFFSLIFYGWLTIIMSFISVLIGYFFILKKTK